MTRSRARTVLGVLWCHIKAGVAATLLSLPVIVPWWWLVGVAHFGFVTGPEPSLRRAASMAAWTLVPGALLLGTLLRVRLREDCGRVLHSWPAVIGAFVGLLPVQVSVGVITLYQYGNDSRVFLLGCGCGLIAIVTTLSIFARRAPERESV